MLCDVCNTLLGHANDDPERLIRAISYLTPPLVQLVREV